jgi:hypothetical protein
MYHFTKNGVLARGLSKSQSAVLDGGVSIDSLTKSNFDKKFYSEGQAQPVINHRSRTGTSVDAGAILRDASGFRDMNAPGANKPRRA